MALIKKRRKFKNNGTSLNITALMDVLTVLLFFLVKAFTISDTILRPPKDIRLPAAIIKEPPEESVVVAISKDVLSVNNQPLMVLSNGRFDRNVIGKDDRTLLPLKNILDQEMGKRLATYQGLGDLSLIGPGKILIQADRELYFRTLKYILHTAKSSNYSDYQFIVETPVE